METQDFEKNLPRILHRLGIMKDRVDFFDSPIIVRVPDDFDFKTLFQEKLKTAGIELIYVDCKTDTADTIYAKMDSVCWFGIISSADIERVKQESENNQKVSSVLLIDHDSDLKDERAKRYIESVLKANKDNQLCGLKNIPLILTFSKDEGMGYFYRSTSIRIIDERCWR